jgi:glycosidase
LLNSINELDLSPKPGKKYWKRFQREWREEFIYFLLIDRFHDDLQRSSVKPDGQQKGFGNKNELKVTCGGTLRGIINHLDYIKDLGCTSLWLSPVFENELTSYHGYAIQNYLSVDRRFGTKEDLEELVDAAHKMDMRVFLDIVLHHAADLWSYPDDREYYYYDGAIFPFGNWRSKDRPVPVELRNPDLFWRKGQIRNFDAYPETRNGDFGTLKAFKNDDSPEALYVQEILTKIHCYWIRETDIDGFRLDAVKHMGEETISRFCSYVREYAYSLGKHNFFLFGELVGPDQMYNQYIGPKTSTLVDDKSIYYGLNSVLDFPLYYVLADVIKGKSTPEKLIDRYESLRVNALQRGEFGEFLVTFIDNHDQIAQTYKQRFGFQATENQIIAGIGFLLCALGAPCIYYGTEQGFNGSGDGDWAVRETMFSLKDKDQNALNKNNTVYKEIAKLAALRKENAPLKFGRMYMRKYSKDGKNFCMPTSEGCLIAFSRILYDEEIVVVFNSSLTLDDDEYIEVDHHINPEGRAFNSIYGPPEQTHVLKSELDQLHFIRVKLAPTQFAVLSNNASVK